MLRPALLGSFALACTLASASHAQQSEAKSMGTVSTTDARVSGGLEVAGDHANLLTNASITALAHTAKIDLARGGFVSVCATSAFHLLHSGSGDALLFALDRGAMELHSTAQAQDSILTPDLRFTLLTKGVLNLRMRVTREGDTCVENRGATAPVLRINDTFGDATYHLAPGQHVLFEHGSLREVVDHETSDCGCPSSTPVMVASTTANGTSAATPNQAEAAHPFPVAESNDLSSTPPVIVIKPGQEAASGTLSFGSGTGKPATTATAAPQATTPAPSVATPSTTSTSTEPPATPPGATAIFRSIGGFFHRLFHGKPKAAPPQS